MIDPSAETNPNTPENQAEPIIPPEPITPSDPIKPPETANKGGWANMSAEKKRGVKIAALVLVLVVIVVIRFASHKSAAALTPAPAPQQAQVTQADVANAEQAAASVPSPDNFLNLSLIYYKVQRYNDCVAAARKAIAIKPDFPAAYNNVAVGFLKMSQWDSAIAAANEAILLKPDFQLAKNNLAAAVDGKKSQQEKILNLEKASSEQPTAENFLDLSAAYYQASEFQKCISAARKAISIKPDLAIAYSNICSANNRLGNFAEGKKAGEEAVRIDPNNQLAKNNLKWSLDELNKNK